MLYTHTHTLCLLNNEEENKIDRRDIYKNASNYGAQLKNETDRKTGCPTDAQPLQKPTQKNINVGADASVRPQKEHNQNKYNVRTINKFKSDVVGGGILDDQKTKNKHIDKPMSNIQTSNLKPQTSNFQRPISNTAITLIALIITIIVLLILTGVTINMVMGENGIFNKANQAKEQTQISTVKEIIRMQVLENDVYKSTNDSKAKSDEELLQPIEEKLTEEGYKVEEGIITIGKIEINIAEEIKNASTEGNCGGAIAGKNDNTKNRTLAGTTTGYSYKNPVIPKGFKAVDVGSATWSYKDSEKTEVTGWDEGLVIQDEIGNQFVWVPVDGSTVPYEKWCTIGIAYNNSINDDTSAIPVTENTQITTYHGFYVAKYEAGLPTDTLEQSADLNNNASTTAVSKEGTKIWNYIDYNNANTVAKTMINNEATYGTTKSGLVTGTQWDTIMKWYQNQNINVDTTQDWGTYYNLPYTIKGTEAKPALWFNSDSSLSTWSSNTTNVSHTASSGRYYHTSGLNADGIKKNIADLGGNVWEWTAEIYSSGRVNRGGDAYNSFADYPASYRNYISTDYAGFNLGFRVALYIQ